MLPDAEGMKYSLAWTGPDDWGQFRMLARELADKMGKKGGIAYITHAPGGSPYFARMFAPRTELKTYAPDIVTLDFQSPGFEAAKTKQVVSDWITRFGDDLNAIVCADDSAQALGVAEALKIAGRDDIIVVAAGNSKIGMDAVKSGDIYAITYQSAEADGAMPIKLAADWFNGKELQNVSYLTKHIITSSDVDSYMPAQW
jgi:ABC-type sugar transport system substrate-binding protein